MAVDVQCIQCGKTCQVIPARVATFKFCSYKCGGSYASKNRVGANSPRWLSGPREKVCGHCGNTYEWKAPKPYSSFLASKFCSKPCADKGGFRHEGEAHANWKPDSRRKNRRGKHGAWARAVISRDAATCQRCGAKDVELHAHHIKPFETFPELRWELSNGLTLCHGCHWTVHAAPNAKAENSGNTLTVKAEGNPEPSFRGNLVEGVTTRGRAFRRWIGECAECNAFLSKRWSDTVGKANLFCNKSCAGKFKAKHYPIKRRGSNASTSTAPERDEIV